MFCPKCGNEINNNERFCGNCGFNVSCCINYTQNAKLWDNSMKKKLYLTKPEKIFIVFISIISLLMAFIRIYDIYVYMSNPDYLGVVFSSDLSFFQSEAISFILLIPYAILSIVISVFVILRHRWAFITFEILNVLQLIVVNLIITFVLIRDFYSSNSFTVALSQNWIAVIVCYIVKGILGVMIGLSYLCQRAVSSKEQSKRKKVIEANDIKIG